MKSTSVFITLFLFILTIACGGARTGEQNIIQLTASLHSSQVVAGSDQTSTGTTSLSLNKVSGKLSGSLKISGDQATAVHVHESFAGKVGPKLLELTELDNNDWALSNDVTLTPGQVTKAVAGELYFKALFTDATSGVTNQIRGQILPPDIDIYTTPLLPPQNVTNNGHGFGAITLNKATGLAEVYVTITDTPTNTITIGHVHDIHDRENVVLAIQRDISSTAALLFRASGVSLSPANIEQLETGRLYFNMHSGETPNLEIELTGGLGYDKNKTLSVSVGLSSHEVVSNNDDSYAAAAHFSIHLQTGEMTGFLTFAETEVAATAVHMREAYAGITGDVVSNIPFSSDDGKTWTIVDNSFLSDTQLEKLQQGQYYINLHYLKNSVGREIRGQIVTDKTRIYVARLQKSGLTARGFAAATIDVQTNEAQLFAQASATADTITHVTFHDHENDLATMFELQFDDSLGKAGAWHKQAILTGAQRSQFALGLVDVSLFHQADNGLRTTLLSGGMSEHIDIEAIETNLSADEVVNGSDTTTTAFATIIYDHHSRKISGEVYITSLSGASEVNIRSAYAGEKGDVVIALESTSVDKWLIPENTTLTIAQAADFEAGRLYYEARLFEDSVNRYLRGQILRDNFDLYISRLAPVEAGSSTATGYAALMLNKNTQEVVVRIQAKTDPGISLEAAHIHDFDSVDISPVALNGENLSTTEFLWKSPTIAVLNRSQILQLESGKYYVQIHRSLNPAIIELAGNFPDKSGAK